MTEDELVGSTDIAVWGLGLIGYTLAGELARCGRRCLIRDIDPERVRRLNEGELPFRHLPSLPHSYAHEAQSGALRATGDPGELLTIDHPIHVLCVPTERDGNIDSNTLAEVIEQIATGAQARPLYVVIESTIAPAWLDTIVHPTFASAGLEHGVDYHLGASPRRDWLTAHGHTLASIPKIIGGDSPQAVRMMRALYGPACGQLLEAHDAKHAALVKVVENYFRYRDILLANELSKLMPWYDITSVLRLASTKWNMDLYHPSLGIGGYCVPLAKDYLGQEPGLEAFADELNTEEEKIFSEARSALRGHGQFQTVAILGIAYAPGMKIHTRSPGVRLARELADEGSTVLVHDPLYSPEEVARITGGTPLRFPEGLRACDSVLVMTDHQLYRDIEHRRLLAHLDPNSCVVDNLGTWSDRAFPGSLRYREVGDRGYFADGRPARIVVASPSATCRAFLESTPLVEVFASAHNVVAIDRRYLTLPVNGTALSMSAVGQVLTELWERPLAEWTDSQAQVLCVLYAVDQARIRLEQVGIAGDLDVVAARLTDLYDSYRTRLLTAGEPGGPPSGERPWWEIARELPVLRRVIDRHYLRLLEIDGQTWHRAELLLPLDQLPIAGLPAPLARDLMARYPDLPAERYPDVDGYLRALAAAEIAAAGSPMALAELVMQHAAEDPRHRSDHATLMCPRGTNLDHPGSLGKEDIGIYVVFHRDFAPSPDSGVGDHKAIRKAMYAHHAAKKVRVAKKIYAPDDTYTQAGLTDDLGSRGIFFNEGAHHRGHVLAGVSSAMRSLMAIQVDAAGERRTVHDLTDWRLSRVSDDPDQRYQIEDYPAFYAYGHWLRAIVETAIGSGVALPAMLGEWR